MYSVRSAAFVAKSQLDHQEHAAGAWNTAQKYGKQIPSFRWRDGQGWSLVFVQWCLFQTGIEVPDGARTASCRTACLAFKKAQRFTEFPVAGAIAFHGQTGSAHASLCTGWDDTYVYTVQGSTGTGKYGVHARRLPRGNDDIHGYGLPYYPHDKAVSPGPWSGKSLAR